jgi:hypothetical protein
MTSSLKPPQSLVEKFVPTCLFPATLPPPAIPEIDVVLALTHFPELKTVANAQRVLINVRWMNKQCEVCLTKTGVKACSACHLVWYCTTKDCQRLHWRAHQHRCMNNTTKPKPPDFGVHKMLFVESEEPEFVLGIQKTKLSYCYDVLTTIVPYVDDEFIKQLVELTETQLSPGKYYRMNFQDPYLLARFLFNPVPANEEFFPGLSSGDIGREWELWRIELEKGVRPDLTKDAMVIITCDTYLYYAILPVNENIEEKEQKTQESK